MQKINILHKKEICNTFVNILHSNNIYFNFCCDSTNDCYLFIFKLSTC